MKSTHKDNNYFSNSNQNPAKRPLKSSNSLFLELFIRFGMGGVLGFDNLVGVAREFLQQVVGGGGGGNAYPVLGWQVERLDDAVVGSTQFVDAVGLALECDDVEVVAIKEREHVAVYIEHQHATGRVKRREGQFLLYIIAQREAVFTIVLNVHRFFI